MFEFREGGEPAKYTELHAYSAFSFGHGLAQPEEMVQSAGQLGLSGLALCDRESFYGAVRQAQAARENGLPTIFGVELVCRVGLGQRLWRLPILCRGEEGYRALSAALSAHNLQQSQRHQPFDLAAAASDLRGKILVLTGADLGGESAAPSSQTPSSPAPRDPRSSATDFPAAHLATSPTAKLRRAAARQAGLFTPGPLPQEALQQATADLQHLKELLGPQALAVECPLGPAPATPAYLQASAALAEATGLPLVATTAARATGPQQKPLADILAATARLESLDRSYGFLGADLPCLRSSQEMAKWAAPYPQALDNPYQLGRDCAFELQSLAPRLPDFPVPPGHTNDSYLRHLTEEGARIRYGTRAQHPAAWKQLDHELKIIADLGFSGYFLIVHEIVEWARSRGILTQGRGSAANSAVCYCLGVTAVDAVRHKMFFERFLSPGRTEYPDVDLDIESQRRDEVIAHVYERYGHRHAAQVAAVISYRHRSAVRDVARALGYSPTQATDFSRHRVPTPPLVESLATQMRELPRHLGLHSAGMVLCGDELATLSPIERAATPGRTQLGWDKDDCADMNLVKFDLLGLGMLTALRRALNALAARGLVDERGKALDLHNLDQEDPQVYRLLQAADTVGVFQVESRAQIATLPRLRPETFYDLVIQVSLVRPGPIQGGSVNPYLRRRRGLEPITYLHPKLRPALEKTLGVPLFQEQMLQIAVDAAGFALHRADDLRRAMGSKRSEARIAALLPELEAGMARQGLDEKSRREVIELMRGFAQYGFPESHAFSFAYLVYASAWLKVHYPEDFYAGILASQPMGFYSPDSLVSDARRHGVAVALPSVDTPVWEAVVLPLPTCFPATAQGRTAWFAPEARATGEDPAKRVHPHPTRLVQLGLQQVQGLGRAAARRIAQAGGQSPFKNLEDLAARARLRTAQLEVLARAGALRCLGVSTREALWAAGTLGRNAGEEGGSQLEIPGLNPLPQLPHFPAPTPAEEMLTQQRYLGMSTTHPLTLLRPQLRQQGVVELGRLGQVEEGERFWVAGVVTRRQRPHTAHGMVFLSLEDETGIVGVRCTPGFWRRYGQVITRGKILAIRGMLDVRYQRNPQLQVPGQTPQLVAAALSVTADAVREIGDELAGQMPDFSRNWG